MNGVLQLREKAVRSALKNSDSVSVSVSVGVTTAVSGKADRGQSLSNAMMRTILADAPKGGAKRLKASLIASMIIYYWILNIFILCIVDSCAFMLFTGRQRFRSTDAFRRIHPAFPVGNMKNMSSQVVQRLLPDGLRVSIDTAKRGLGIHKVA